MTHQQGFRLVTRALAVYFLFWVVDDIINVPRECFDVISAWPAAAHSALELHYLRVYLLYLAANVFKIALWSTLAMAFYRGAPVVQRFFADAPDTPSRDSVQSL